MKVVINEIKTNLNSYQFNCVLTFLVYIYACVWGWTRGSKYFEDSLSFLMIPVNKLIAFVLFFRFFNRKVSVGAILMQAVNLITFMANIILYRVLRLNLEDGSLDKLFAWIYIMNCAVFTGLIIIDSVLYEIREKKKNDYSKLHSVGFDDSISDLCEITGTKMAVQSYDKTSNHQALQQGENVFPVENESIPLRIDDKKGRVLIAAEYEKLQISMKRTHGLTELIVNGNVYDEVKGTVEFEYSLIAKVENIIIAGAYSSTRLHVYLYADGMLIAKKIRIY